jgi:nucleoid-associated protein YgaU
MDILQRIGLRKTGTRKRGLLGGKVIRVNPGDTLMKIAAREYGDENQWERILEANKSKIKDPESLYPGVELRLP